MTHLTQLLPRLLLSIRAGWLCWRAVSQPKNVAKGHWGGLSLWTLCEFAGAELKELKTEAWACEMGRGDAGRLELESGDVIAFAAMIADNAGRKGNLK